MKDQYVGDVNDYRKYALLRTFLRNGISLGVNWMLTPADNRADGLILKYLSAPTTWRAHDHELFDGLKTLISSGSRSVAAVEAAALLPGAAFHRDPTPRDVLARKDWLNTMLAAFKGKQLVFFDPDNGLEVKSAPAGSQKAPKFLFWDEVAKTFAAGHSLLVYQHFKRKPRELTLKRIEITMRDLGATETHAFLTPYVAFVLMLQRSNEQFQAALAQVRSHRHPFIWTSP